MSDWMPIPGFPGYEASSDGYVRSARTTLSPWLSSGYLTVSLRRDGKTHRVHIHRLVLMAHVSLPPSGFDGCHNDGERLNNHVGNLRWATRSENILDQVRHGRHNNASKTHCKRGHEFTEANTYRRGERRECLACIRTASSTSHARKKASA